MPDGFQFAYEKVESRIQLMISEGVLRPGDRVPSIREICRSERVSPATAVRALTNLEAKSLLFAKLRSGFYVQSIPRLPLPKPAEGPLHPQRPSLSDDVARVFRDIQKHGTISLGAGAPDQALMPTEEISKCVARAARQYSHEFGSYSMCDTDLSLRKEIALRLARASCIVSPEEIVITNGCMDAINIAIRAVASPGDIVLVESPTYFGLLQMIESLGMQAISVPATCDGGIDIDVFERTIMTHQVAACILIPSFGNPHGANLADAKREALVRIAAKKGIPIIENDIYGELGFDDNRPRLLKSFGDPTNTLLCGSLSKSLSPSLRVGWLVAGRYAENARRLKWISSIATPHVTAKAAADYLRSGGFDRHLRGLRKVLQTQMCRISTAIAQSFPQGTALSRPSGGYFLWVELPWRVNAVALRDVAIESDISVCPGPIFSIAGEFQNFIRLNCALQLDEKVQDAIRALGGMAHALNTPKKARREVRQESTGIVNT
jgi:DNA-binding transcriptional MocR family regulator